MPEIGPRKILAGITRAILFQRRKIINGEIAQHKRTLTASWNNKGYALLLDFKKDHPTQEAKYKTYTV